MLEHTIIDYVYDFIVIFPIFITLLVAPFGVMALIGGISGDHCASLKGLGLTLFGVYIMSLVGGLFFTLLALLAIGLPDFFKVLA